MVPHKTWPTEDLVGRLCHALGIANNVIERLATNGYRDEKHPAVNVRPEKLISETALLAFVASAVTDHRRVAESVESLVRLLIPHARSDKVLLGVCLHPALALDYAQGHVFLSMIGYPDRRFDRLLRQSIGSQAALGRERPPHRMLEQQWIMELWDGAAIKNLTSVRAMTSASALNSPMDLLGASREDIYAFTHALMYVRRFNIRPLRMPRSNATIVAEVEAALSRCLDEQDYDLAGELLLTWPLIGRPWSPVSTFGFRVLTSVEDEAGFLPTPSTRIDRINALGAEERVDYLLATMYHTVYVMGLLCAAALQPGCAPSLSIATANRTKGAAAALLERLSADSDIPHWYSEMLKLTDRERDAIAGFLLSAALRRRYLAQDYAGIRELLKVGLEFGLVKSPAASQAGEMLERLATFAGIRARASNNIYAKRIASKRISM